MHALQTGQTHEILSTYGKTHVEMGIIVIENYNYNYNYNYVIKNCN